MADPSRKPEHPMAVAYEWVGRIVAAAVMMIGPVWLCDRYLGPGPWTLVALFVGVAAGMGYLILVTSAWGRSRGGARRNGDNGGNTRGSNGKSVREE